MTSTVVWLVSCCVCALACLVVIKSRVGNLGLDRVDKPNALHSVPTLRLGGIALVVAVSLVMWGSLNRYVVETSLATIFFAAIVLAMLSLWDDIRGLSSGLRFVVHLTVSGLTVVALYPAIPVDIALSTHLLVSLSVCFLIVLAIAWMTNVYNFMDGANGLAGFMGVIGFGTLALASASAQLVQLSIVCASLSGACAGFLAFNFPKARLFMGDGGSIPLGFLAATLGLYGALIGAWHWLLPLLTFSPFIVDASVTLAKRAWRRQRLWEGHREHYYHRLILRLGWSQTRTALAYAALMVLAGGTALWAYSAVGNANRVAHSVNASAEGLTFATWVVTYGCLIVALELRFQREESIKTK